MDGKDLGNSTPTGVTGSLREPHGEAKALANPGQKVRRGAVSGVLEPDPLIERAMQAVIQRAGELGVELEGRVWIKSKGQGDKITKAGVHRRLSYDVHCGRPKLGTLSHDQLVRADVESLFKLHRVLWLHVVAPPENVSWPEWSGPLFAIRWALGSLMDASIDTLRLAERSGNDKALLTLAYQAIVDKEEQGKLRDKALKDFKRTGSASDKAKSEFSISGATASCASNVVYTGYKRYLDGEIGYPSWTGPRSAIYIRADSISLREESYLNKDSEEDVHYVASFKVVGGTGTTHECVVRVNGDSDRATLKRILKGEHKPGEAKLMWDEKRKRWQISLSYAMARVPPKAGEKDAGFLAVRRSVQDMLFIMNNKGERFPEAQFIGLRIIELRKQFTRRKSEAKRGLNLQGKGARGHGRGRFFRRYKMAQDQEVNAIDTSLKQLASSIRKAAEASNAKVVFLEDFGVQWSPSGGDERFVRLLKRMPWAKAEEILRHELEEHGIRIKRMAQAHNVSECPVCGSKTKVVDDSVDCESCKLLCHRHIVAVWNMLKAAGVDTTQLEDLKRKVSYVTRALRRRQVAAAERALKQIVEIPILLEDEDDDELLDVADPLTCQPEPHEHAAEPS